MPRNCFGFRPRGRFSHVEIADENSTTVDALIEDLSCSTLKLATGATVNAITTSMTTSADSKVPTEKAVKDYVGSLTILPSDPAAPTRIEYNPASLDMYVEGVLTESVASGCTTLTGALVVDSITTNDLLTVQGAGTFTKGITATNGLISGTQISGGNWWKVYQNSAGTDDSVVLSLVTKDIDSDEVASKSMQASTSAGSATITFRHSLESGSQINQPRLVAWEASTYTPSVEIDQSITSGRNGNIGWYPCQGFISHTGRRLYSIKHAIYNSPAQNITCTINLGTSYNPAAIIATSDVVAYAGGSGFSEFVFATQPILTAEVQYCYTIRQANTTSGFNSWYDDLVPGGPYSEGCVTWYKVSDGTLSVNANRDFKFQILTMALAGGLKSDLYVFGQPEAGSMTSVTITQATTAPIWEDGGTGAYPTGHSVADTVFFDSDDLAGYPPSIDKSFGDLTSYGLAKVIRAGPQLTLARENALTNTATAEVSAAGVLTLTASGASIETAAANVLRVNSSTASTSSTTGSAVLGGGLGLGGAENAGGAITSNIDLSTAVMVASFSRVVNPEVASVNSYVAVGGPVITAGKLVLTGGIATKYVNLDAAVNLAALATCATYRWKYTPNYNGHPTKSQMMFVLNEGTTGTNMIYVQHALTTGLLKLTIADSSATSQVSKITYDWSPTLGQEYEFEIAFSSTTGAYYMFVDGAVIYSGTVAAYTRTASNTTWTAGTDMRDATNAGYYPSFSIRDFCAFPTIMHTLAYVKGYSTIGVNTACAADFGGINANNLVVTGTTRTGPIIATSTGTPLSLAYDSTHYATMVVDAGGDLTVNASGNDVIIDASDNLKVNCTEAATTTTSGALRIVGGCGLGGALIAGGVLQTNSAVNSTSTITGAIRAPSGGLGIALDANIGGSLACGAATCVSAATALTLGYESALTNKASLAVGATGALTIDSSGNVVNIAATDVLHELCTTNATNDTTGAICTPGGISCEQDGWIGGQLHIDGALTAGGLSVPSLEVSPQTTTLSGPWAAPETSAVVYTRLGGHLVFAYFPIHVTAASSSAIISTDATVPAGWRSANIQYTNVDVIDNSVAVAGCCGVYSAGSFHFGIGTPAGAYTNAGNCGMSELFISWYAP